MIKLLCQQRITDICKLMKTYFLLEVAKQELKDLYYKVTLELSIRGYDYSLEKMRICSIFDREMLFKF